ncbi:MAG: hypothetical protein DHS20C17_08090 [Cyclobacteriaceae bacterium]|nr:MAG: hypothetical protein DHS20C17_08090 [Cyclobacteriaceae bacterium]
MTLVIFLPSCLSSERPDVEIRGIYGHPKPFWEQGINLKDLGVNAVFVHSGAIDQEMVSRARGEGLRIFAEFATLNGKNYVESHPESWAINHKGEKVEAATWFMGVCPTEPGFREYRFTQLRKLLQEFELDGVWMDYVHWHAQFEDPQPVLPETCFCDHCLDKFTADTGVQPPDGTTREKAAWILTNSDPLWRDWRCKVIVEWATELKSILKQEQPEALLGLYHCPWQDHEFEGASRRILGLDYDLLGDVIDVFSPMVYHGRMERSPQWVGANIDWFSQRLNIQKDKGPKIWSIVQAYDDPRIISAAEFETVLRGGLSGKSTGVMMFTSNAVAEDKEKIAIMRQLYSSLKQSN